MDWPKIQRAVHKVATGNVLISTAVVGAVLIVVGVGRLVVGGPPHLSDALVVAVPGVVLAALGYLGEKKLDPASPARSEVFGPTQRMQLGGLIGLVIGGLYLLLFSAVLGIQAWGPHHGSMWKPGAASLGLLAGAVLCFVAVGRGLRRYLSAPKPTGDSATDNRP
ncbi:hypothetical protein [Mycobacterium branderi]|uniref:hypothetical protein n=1 Tax=Mycobacterium branderi TaxID=43348 RepID=UPI0013D4A9F6|nr:hypothetical protein [Mycobacterium branderi]MCV7236245.1 hypothetical protein [Mycobacterium branderi]